MEDIPADQAAATLTLTRLITSKEGRRELLENMTLCPDGTATLSVMGVEIACGEAFVAKLRAHVERDGLDKLV